MKLLNPLIRFSDKMIPGFLEMKARYLVAQTYERGQVEGSPKHPLLLSDYSDIGLAKLHFQNVRAVDQWAAIIDLLNPKHSTKLLDMCEPASKYRLFAAFVENKNDISIRLNKHISANTKDYIDNKTDWKPGRNEAVKADLQLIFGHLFVTLKCKRQQIRVKLSELEQPCVTTSVLPPVSESYRIIFQVSNSTLR